MTFATYSSSRDVISIRFFASYLMPRVYACEGFLCLGNLLEQLWKDCVKSEGSKPVVRVKSGTRCEVQVRVRCEDN